MAPFLIRETGMRMFFFPAFLVVFSLCIGEIRLFSHFMSYIAHRKGIALKAVGVIIIAINAKGGVPKELLNGSLLSNGKNKRCFSFPLLDV